MGGLDTEVTDGTVDILLEAATFEPGRTSRTSRNLGLFSESSMRYERGVDDHGIEAVSYTHLDVYKRQPLILNLIAALDEAHDRLLAA